MRYALKMARHVESFAIVAKKANPVFPYNTFPINFKFRFIEFDFRNTLLFAL